MIKTIFKLKAIPFLLGIAAICCLSACSEAGLAGISPDKACWQARDQLSFEIEHEGGRFPLEVALSSTDDYGFSNLYLKLEASGPRSWSKEIRFSETFIDPMGNWLIEQDGSVFPYLFSSFGDLELPHPGKYTFTLTHDMRKDPLCGVKQIQARIKTEQ